MEPQSELVSAKTVPAATISHRGATELIDAALRAAAEMGFAAAVAVTDTAGHLRSFERTDGAPAITVEVAVDKAWTAVHTGMATHILSTIIVRPELAPLAKNPRMMPVSGGCPILADGLLVGGIGVSGGIGDQDQQVAEIALKALAFAVA